MHQARQPHSTLTRLHRHVFRLSLVAVLVIAPRVIGQPIDRQAVADEMELSLKVQLLEMWYPRAVDDEHGGFLSTYDYRWEPEGPQEKMIVTQARHTWTTAKATEFFPEEADLYRSASSHGFSFLRDVMWDNAFGGFFNLVKRDGQIVAEAGDSLKQAYGNAFAIYGLAAYFAASRDSAALQLAIDAFHWLEEHSHDPVNGGYFQYLSREGKPLVEGYEGTPPKDQNSSIHLLEAFSELYHVWPDSLLRERLAEMLFLIRDTITTEQGFLTLFFHEDWTPVSYRDSSEAVREANQYYDHVSFGHDVETAFLMLEASEVLGLENDTTTVRIARKMVDHALANGWDREVGGFYDEGYYFEEGGKLAIIKDTKNWWAQAEGLNALLLMAELFPDDEMQYYDRFLQLWEYVKSNLIDQEHGGWFAGGLDKQPYYKTGQKGHIWKAAYHESRSLISCIERLRSDALLTDGR